MGVSFGIVAILGLVLLVILAVGGIVAVVLLSAGSNRREPRE
jgi:hypothetical protein